VKSVERTVKFLLFCICPDEFEFWFEFSFQKALQK